MKRCAVIGLGRFGQKLAIALTMNGAEVIAVDRDRSIIEQIRDQVSHAVRLDSTDEDALKAQGIDKVDIAIVGMGKGGGAFESAIMTVVNLKAIGVKKIYARAESLTAGEVFSAVGAAEVVYPEIETAQRWAYKLIAPHIGEKVDFVPGYSMASVKAPPSFHEKTIMDLELRQRYNVNIVAVRRGTSDESKKDKKDVITVPIPSTVIYAGDILMVVASDADLAKLPQE